MSIGSLVKARVVALNAPYLTIVNNTQSDILVVVLIGQRQTIERLVDIDTELVLGMIDEHCSQRITPVIKRLVIALRQQWQSNDQKQT